VLAAGALVAGADLVAALVWSIDGRISGRADLTAASAGRSDGGRCAGGAYI